MAFQFNVDNAIFNKYIFDKVGYTNKITENTQTTYFYKVTAKYGADIWRKKYYIVYGSEVYFNASDVLQIKNPQVQECTYSTLNFVSISDKYFWISEDVNTTVATNATKIYHGLSGAALEHYWSDDEDTGKETVALKAANNDWSKFRLLTATKTTDHIEFMYGDVADEYPDSQGTNTIYRRGILSNHGILTGSYVGNGGTSLALMFDISPQAILIVLDGKSNGDSTISWGLLIRGSATGFVRYGSSSSYVNQAELTWGSRSVTINGGAANKSLNVNAANYRYVVFA